jgi:glucose-1-phosphate cytidylyltransferase
MRAGRVELMHSDISDWSITFVDTGLESAIGERLRRVRHHLNGDEYFLANYADVLTDAPMDQMIEKFHHSGWYQPKLLASSRPTTVLSTERSSTGCSIPHHF